MPSIAKLTYWDGQGNAEIIRLMLAACNEPWEDAVALDKAGATHLTSRSQFEKMMAAGLLAFDQTPLLQIDGLNLVQKMAACRYLARKHGLYGAENAEATQIDILVDGMQDFAGRGLEEDSQLKYLPRLARALGGNSFLVGDSLSLADVVMFHALSRVPQDVLEHYPTLVVHSTTVAAVPSIAAYLADSSKRFPVPGLPGYMDRVVRTIPWIRSGGGPPPPLRSQTWQYRSNL
eukprot:SAG31_NODE_1571_length_7851_cov_8.714525_2_plen_233_part_00